MSEVTTRLKSIFGGCIGNLVEWYDWYVYSSFSLYFAGSFFPKSSETAKLLNTAGIFAIGFLMRPIGCWLMGLYTYRFGRKVALELHFEKSKETLKNHTENQQSKLLL